MKRMCTIVNILLLAAVAAGGLVYSITDIFAFKAAASFLFTAESVFNTIICFRKKADMKFPVWMTVAVFFAFAADVAITINFIAGAIFFSITHILYIAAMCKLERFTPVDIIFPVCIASMLLTIVALTPFLSFNGMGMEVVVCVYVLIISMMTGKALCNSVKKSRSLNVLIAVAGIVFMFSDLMLMLNKFGNISWAKYFCLNMYYPAQIMFALSPLVYLRDKVKEKTCD